MKTIEVKYLGPTNFKGSRMRATDGDHTIIKHIADNLSIEENADLAATEFAAKKGWVGFMIRGGTKEGWVYVFANDHVIRLPGTPSGPVRIQCENALTRQR